MVRGAGMNRIHIYSTARMWPVGRGLVGWNVRLFMIECGQVGQGFKEPLTEDQTNWIYRKASERRTIHVDRIEWSTTLSDPYTLWIEGTQTVHALLSSTWNAYMPSDTDASHPSFGGVYEALTGGGRVTYPPVVEDDHPIWERARLSRGLILKDPWCMDITTPAENATGTIRIDLWGEEV